ncbi:unnamed protein product [Linum tenue]|uniref:Uncharacterized protein n=1 Tax=Linum tenue TaxID=586396 RepID=A0AAV0LJ63_9ROSI|nr:unnamed protein product [Linum tenue]
MRSVVFSVLFLALAIFSASCFQLAEMRPLKEDGDGDNYSLLLQSLQKGPVQGSGPNPCTNIPGRNQGTCTSAVSAMNVAGDVFARSPQPPLAASRLAVSSHPQFSQSS